MKRAIPVDVYNKDGEMVKIEFNDANGEHVMDAVWDPTDEQTSENRVTFRKWAYNHVRKQGWEILK